MKGRTKAPKLSPVERIRRQAVREHPAFASGEVHCMNCGETRTVDSEACMRTGWPTCCGETMQLGRRSLS